MNLLRKVAVLCCFACATSFADREWTFLVFLNGNNDLVEYGDININQMETIGSSDEVDFIVQWAKMGEQQTHRLRVLKDSDEAKVTSPFVESLPRIDMGDYNELVNFVNWGIAKYPAKHYFVVVWNHGSGWHRNRPLMRDISNDIYSGHSITSTQLGLAMQFISNSLGRKIDMFGADACLMAMAEIGAEIAPYASHLVASQDLEPALGWPYHKLAAWWVEHPTASVAEVGRVLVSQYAEAFAGSSGITLSTVNLDLLEPFLENFRVISNALINFNDATFANAVARLSEVQAFAFKDYADIGSMLKLLPLNESASLLGAYSQLVIASKTSAEMNKATGLSIWIPDSKETHDKYIESYQALKFTKTTGWDRVVTRYSGLLKKS